MEEAKEESENIPTGGMSLAEFKKQAAAGNESQEGQYSTLISGYEALTRQQKDSIAKPVSENGLDISTAEELIEQYEIANEQNGMTQEEMLERLKKCYK
mgnify:FL=1